MNRHRFLARATNTKLVLHIIRLRRQINTIIRNQPNFKESITYQNKNKKSKEKMYVTFIGNEQTLSKV